MPAARRPFLSASWRNLAMVNYEVDPSALATLVPPGTELDPWRGRHFISLVGFLFENTRVLSIPPPLHQTFEEVNLRFYVRRKAPEGWRRGVSFIKEIVPRAAVAWLARSLYHENYLALPMRHSFQETAVTYEWKLNEKWNAISMTSAGDPLLAAEGSEEEYITEHYWGYTKRRDGRTSEYQVDHPPWRVWTPPTFHVDCDFDSLYGHELSRFFRGKPSSAFLAEGSPITVYAASILVP
jgi:uncharacterized protein YqjF (DUF2071 family)